MSRLPSSRAGTPRSTVAKTARAAAGRSVGAATRNPPPPARVRRQSSSLAARDLDTRARLLQVGQQLARAKGLRGLTVRGLAHAASALPRGDSLHMVVFLMMAVAFPFVAATGLIRSGIVPRDFAATAKRIATDATLAHRRLEWALAGLQSGKERR